jgi:hypothetical protein
MRKNIDVSKNDKEDAKFNLSYHYISVEAFITERPRPSATIYRDSVVQQEVRSGAILLFETAKGGERYPIRFIHDRTIELAMKLRVGDKIWVEMGRFGTMHGQKETEFLIKSFKKF